MVKRYELTQAQWDRIAHLAPGKAGDPGRTGADDGLFVNDVSWVLCAGTHRVSGIGFNRNMLSGSPRKSLRRQG